MIDMPKCCGKDMKLKKVKGINGYYSYYFCEECDKRIMAKEFAYGKLSTK